MVTGLLLLVFSGPLFARTVWVTGIVTKAPWVEEYRYIEVNNIKYTFMQTDVRLAKRYKADSGAWGEKQISFRDIREGQTVWIRIQGRRIYQLIVEER